MSGLPGITVQREKKKGKWKGSSTHAPVCLNI